VTAGDGAQKGPKPVRTKLLSQAADAARLAGGVFQAVYYAVKTWFLTS
jgi:hypothetical protein